MKVLSFVVIVLAAAACWGQGLGKRLDALRPALDRGEHRQLVARYAHQAKADVFAACAADAALRRWFRLHQFGLEPQDSDQVTEGALLAALKQHAKAHPDAAVSLALYWHESGFESFRMDKPDATETTPLRSANGRPILGADGHPITVVVERYSTQDPARVKRMASYFETAKKLAPNDKEVLYIEALHEKDSVRKYDLFLRSYNQGGKEVFGLGFYDKLASAAAGAGKAEDAAKWRSVLEAKIAANPNGLGTKLYLAMKARKARG